MGGTHELNGPSAGEEADAFWTEDVPLGEVLLAGRPRPVRLAVHRDEESYSRGYGRTEIVPFAPEPGVRDYVLVHPYVLVPDLRLHIGLYPAPSPEGAIGEVIAARHALPRRERIGDGQAWYYRRDRTLVVWEMTLFERFAASGDPSEDPALRALWEGFERYLLDTFPHTRRLVTPAWEPSYETERWRVFLATLGYRAQTLLAFAKDSDFVTPRMGMEEPSPS